MGWALSADVAWRRRGWNDGCKPVVAGAAACGLEMNKAAGGSMRGGSSAATKFAKLETQDKSEQPRMNAKSRKCPECGGGSLYTTRVDSSGYYGPNLLPGLGGFLRGYAEFDIVVCAICGLTRFYAEERAREKLSRSAQWRPLSGETHET